MQPFGPIRAHINVSDGANLRANTAIDAIVVSVKMAVHQRKLTPYRPAGFPRQSRRRDQPRGIAPGVSLGDRDPLSCDGTQGPGASLEGTFLTLFDRPQDHFSFIQPALIHFELVLEGSLIQGTGSGHVVSASP
jgi:hypothetical protein